MLFPGQGAALNDRKYQFALSALPVAHHQLDGSGHEADKPHTIVNKVMQCQLQQQTLLANAVRTRKEASGSYFANAIVQPGGNGALASASLKGHQQQQQQLLCSNMSYQAHQIQRERQLAQYVQRLEEEDKQTENRHREARLKSLEQAHVVDRVKLHQSARQRIELQHRSHQRLPEQQLKRFGLDNVHEEIAAAKTVCAESRRAARDLPRQAHVEYNLPRIVDAALMRQERLDAHRTRIQNRVALEEKVQTSFACQRKREHRRLNKARQIAGLLASGTSNSDHSDNNCDEHGGMMPPAADLSGVHLLSLNKNNVAGNPLSLYPTRRPGREEIRDARELEKRWKMEQAAMEQEKRQLLAEMSEIDKQASIAEKQARKSRKQARFTNSDSD